MPYRGRAFIKAVPFQDWGSIGLYVVIICIAIYLIIGIKKK